MPPQTSIYGAPRPTTKPTPTTNPSSTAFNTTLSSLIATNATTTPRPRPSSKQTKSSLPQSNKDTKKRAAADMLGLTQRNPTTTSKDAPLTDADWSRAKRNMSEKARLYAALKRGDVDDATEKYGVDFDRKWAERHANGGDGEEDTSSDSDSDDSPSDDDDGTDILHRGDPRKDTKAQLVEYTDSLGRTRTGTAREAAREKRRQARSSAADADLTSFRARPAAPKAVIYGDAVQAAAFNPDEGRTAAMEELAAKRDREATPPEAARYDAASEVRTKGQGFFAFSRDEGERAGQMEELEGEREETERVRGEKVKSGEERRRRREEQVEERRRFIREKRGKAQADRFLEDLGSRMTSGEG